MIDALRLLGADRIEEIGEGHTIQHLIVACTGRSCRRALIVERTYRAGVYVLLDPTDDEIAAARKDGWSAWNSDRAAHYETDEEGETKWVERKAR